jgi:hypothetical protein
LVRQLGAGSREPKLVESRRGSIRHPQPELDQPRGRSFRHPKSHIDQPCRSCIRHAAIRGDEPKPGSGRQSAAFFIDPPDPGREATAPCPARPRASRRAPEGGAAPASPDGRITSRFSARDKAQGRSSRHSDHGYRLPRMLRPLSAKRGDGFAHSMGKAQYFLTIATSSSLVLHCSSENDERT